MGDDKHVIETDDGAAAQWWDRINDAKETYRTLHVSKGNMASGWERSEERTRTEISSRISAIWALALERPEVDEDSDFYFHGGDHFLAPVMIQNINDELGLKLTVRDLEQARTIAKLTDLIYFEQTRIDQSTVVPLRNVHASRPPLFIVHGVGGNVLGFYALAKCLDESQPVYGIQAQALLPERPAVLRLEQMAAQYVKDMREVCPQGPYHLLGFSFGGLVAYEIAQQLSAAGLEVGLVGMLDTRQPEWMRELPRVGPLHRQVYERMKLVYLRTNRRKGRLRYLWRRVRERVQRANYMYAASKGRGQVAATVRNVREINLVAGISYKVRPYPGKVTLFRAESDPSEQLLPLDLDWGKFVKDGLTIKHMPGDHGRILYQPGLGALARELTEYLREAHLSHGDDASFVDFSDTGSARVSMEI
jgi:thioesterase domain-containing protein/acyl carrier protein